MRENTFRKIEDPLAPWFGHQLSDFGLPSSEAAEQIDAIENLYIRWRNDSGVWWRKLATFIAREPLRIFREQTKILIVALAKELANKTAAVQQTESASRAIKQIERNGELRAFLMDNFPADLDAADAANTPLHKVCMTVMLRQAEQFSNSQIIRSYLETKG